VIAARGIAYSERNRDRMERLCTAEQNRFAVKLAAHDPERYPAELLRFDFNDEHWHGEWTMSQGQWLKAFVGRWMADAKGEPCAAPNNGPAKPVAKSGVTEGPPSAS
jgi:hypothetical protein